MRRCEALRRGVQELDPEVQELDPEVQELDPEVQELDSEVQELDSREVRQGVSEDRLASLVSKLPSRALHRR